MKRLGKVLKYIGIFCVCLFVVDAAIVIGFSVYRPAIPKADAIVVLGAAINTPAVDNRSYEALRLYEQGKANELVLSGGVDYPRSISEAQYMKKVILAKDSSAPLILDENSHSTYENIKDSKALIPQAQSVIIVSDSFHLARGVLLAKRAGFNHVYWSSPSQSYYSVHDLVFYYLREMAAMVEYVPKFIHG